MGIEMGYLQEALGYLEALDSLIEQENVIENRRKYALNALNAPSQLPPWPSRPDELATWPIELRQRWGERANELEDEGLSWRDAERQAFAEVKATPAQCDSSAVPAPEKPPPLSPGQFLWAS
jgi:hypothetical protein